MSAGPVDKVADIFKDLIFDALVKNAITYVIGLAPFLSFGPIAFIVSKAITYIAGIVYDQLKLAINFQVILLNNEMHQKAFIDAQYSLSKLGKEKGIDSPEFKVMREKHKVALAKFVRNSGT